MSGIIYIFSFSHRTKERRVAFHLALMLNTISEEFKIFEKLHNWGWGFVLVVVLMNIDDDRKPVYIHN